MKWPPPTSCAHKMFSPNQVFNVSLLEALCRSPCVQSQDLRISQVSVTHWTKEYWWKEEEARLKDRNGWLGASVSRSSDVYTRATWAAVPVTGKPEATRVREHEHQRQVHRCPHSHFLSYLCYLDSSCSCPHLHKPAPAYSSNWVVFNLNVLLFMLFWGRFHFEFKKKKQLTLVVFFCLRCSSYLIVTCQACRKNLFRIVTPMWMLHIVIIFHQIYFTLWKNTY